MNVNESVLINLLSQLTQVILINCQNSTYSKKYYKQLDSISITYKIPVVYKPVFTKTMESLSPHFKLIEDGDYIFFSIYYNLPITDYSLKLLQMRINNIMQTLQGYKITY